MKTKIAFGILFAFLACHAQEKETFNLDFEQQNSQSKLAKGWMPWGSYTLKMDSNEVQSGKYAAFVTSEGGEGGFGSIAYKLPANYEGKQLRLEGYMKTENVEDGFSGLLIRVDGESGALAFDNMQSQDIHGTRDWAKYSVEVEFPDGAEHIFVAGILVGKGKAWFDDLVLKVDGKDIQKLKQVEKQLTKAELDKEFDQGSDISFPELTPERISDLELLGRVWGFLKYHHPEVGKGNYNWDYELFRVLPKVIAAKNTSARDEILINWINQYGEIPYCTNCEPTADEAFLKPGFSWFEEAALSVSLVKSLGHVYHNRHQGKHHYIKMAPNVGNPDFLHEASYPKMTYPDAGFRLLALYRYWNMIHYFFPYTHLMDKDWDEILGEYIPKFIEAKDELAYEIAALQIIGDIQDTHANLWGGGNKISEMRGTYYPPFHVRFVEDQLVVTDYYNPEFQETAGLDVGDVISHVNGKAVSDWVKELKDYYPASNQDARLRDISTDLLRSTSGNVDIQYQSKSGAKEKRLKLYPQDSLSMYRWYPRDSKKCYKMLDNNIGYITLKSIQQTDIAEIKKEFKDTQGIIIDIRNYPSTFVPFSLGSFFVSSNSPFVKFTRGNRDNPGEFTFTPNIEIPKSKNSYTGKLVVLVNELSQSQAEYTAMAFRAGDNTTIIGSTTAGADGNVSTIFLPGGLRTMISGIGVYYPDGKETQRIGIVPDIEVRPTIEGIRQGRDELMEKAIEVILDN